MTTPAPSDARRYVRIAVDLSSSNRKTSNLPVPAKWLLVCGIIAAGRDLTDGHIRPRVVTAEADVPDRTADALIKAGRWHLPGHECAKCPQPDAGFVYIHDYLEHQRSRQQVTAATESAKRGADLTNHKRYHKGDPREDCYWCRYGDQYSEQGGDQ